MDGSRSVLMAPAVKGKILKRPPSHLNLDEPRQDY